MSADPWVRPPFGALRSTAQLLGRTAWFARWNPQTAAWIVPPWPLIGRLPTCKIEPQIAAFLVDGALLWIAIRSSGMGQHGRCSRRNGGLPDRSEVLAVTRDGAVGQPLRLPYRSAYPWLRLVDGRLLGRQQDPGSRRRRSVGFRIECADR